MSRVLTIPARFNGPPASANGGVTCGLLAQATGLDEVTLRRPPPLEVPLELRDGSLYDGDALVASAGAAVVTLSAPPPVGVAEATEASRSYAGFQDHPFPTCFVCGTERSDGLGLHPGRVREGTVAAPWTPVDDDPVMVWAALDCPGGWSHDLPGRPMVLGRMACRVDALPVPGEQHVVTGWRVGEEGRKVFTGSSLHTADGRLLAIAQQTWVVLTP